MRRMRRPECLEIHVEIAQNRSEKALKIHFGRVHVPVFHLEWDAGPFHSSYRGKRSSILPYSRPHLEGFVPRLHLHLKTILESSKPSYETSLGYEGCVFRSHIPLFLPSSPFPFSGIGPEAESSPVTLRIKYGICPGISGISPNPAAESNLG